VISFNATADRLDNKLLITFVTLKDLEPIDTQVITLPDKVGDLEALVSVLDKNPTEIEPSDLNSTSFQTAFIKYTLGQNYKTVNLDALNGHYSRLFEVDVSDILDNELDAMESLLNNLKLQTDKNVEAYKKSKENITPPSGGPDAAQPGAHTPPGLKISVPSQKPSDGVQKPKIDISKLTEAEKKKLTALPEDLRVTLEGLFGDRLVEPRPLWMQYPGEVVINNENNSWCILGRDFGRYGVDGSTGAGAVWLAAGLSPHDLTMEESAEGEGDQKLIYRRANLKDDGAYLYLSEKCDIDDLLGPGIAGGTYVKRVGPRKAESVAALKADGVVVLARQSGIRLITGSDKKNTAGGNISAKYGIDLIAGNDDSDLQPMVKGNNLVTYLKALSERLSELQAIVFKFIQGQTEFNTAVGSHSHYDPFLIMLGASIGQPTAVMGGKCFASTECATAGFKATLAALQDMQSGVNQSINQIGGDFNSLTKVGKYGILSDKNRVN